MNWEEVGAIGQVLGSIAVFVTLGIWRHRCGTRGRKRGGHSAKVVRRGIANSWLKQGMRESSPFN